MTTPHHWNRWIAIMALAATLCQGVSAADEADSTLATEPVPTTLQGTRDVSPVKLTAVREAIQKGEFDEALELVRRAVTVAAPEKKGPLRLLEARILVRRGSAEVAGGVYRRLLRDPEYGKTARSELHDLLVRRGQFSRADRLTEAAAHGGIRADPELLSLRAHSASAQARYAECVRLTTEPALSGRGDATVLRANALLALGDADAAGILFDRVIREENDPKLRQIAHFGLAQVARSRGGRAVRALQDEKAVRLGRASWAELDWGLALRALGRRDEARERLESVLENDDFLANSARLALARLDEEAGRTESALEHLADTIEGSAVDFIAYTRLGDLLLQEGQEEAGIEAYQMALEIFPSFPMARERLTRELGARGRWDEVPEALPASWEPPAGTWERMLDGDLPFHSIVADRDSLAVLDPRRVLLALSHLRAGAFATVLALTEEVELSAHPFLARVRAEALEEVGRTDEAEAQWSALAEAGAPQAPERLARVVFRRDAAEGEELWRRVLRDRPLDARARIRLARALEHNDDLEGALEVYQSAADSSWLSVAERRRLKVTIEDLEDLVAEAEERLETDA